VLFIFISLKTVENVNNATCRQSENVRISVVVNNSFGYSSTGVYDNDNIHDVSYLKFGRTLPVHCEQENVQGGSIFVLYVSGTALVTQRDVYNRVAFTRLDFIESKPRHLIGILCVGSRCWLNRRARK